jgi:hypothetical protein
MLCHRFGCPAELSIYGYIVCIQHVKAILGGICMRRGHMKVFMKPWLWALLLASAPLVASVGTVLGAIGAESPAKPMVEETEWDGVKVELMSVERTPGHMLTIKFKYTNSGSGKAEIAKLGQYGHDNVVEHVYYVDTKSKKKYLVVKDAEGKALGTNLKYFTLAPGESKSAWAKFPEPPADVQKISVYLPGTPPFEDVPIQ